ncbi:hypothetical protein ASF58_20780 [Methylobacterium sp. Leaf125]|uniref:hypothetical protein n=1 Tax=Methylobacterium sp. Leaf125 TaxID=1736265 RepID=UPI0006FF06E9|nr:hypothetical protein [Methylobacterium sp. Leaf125]KQQ44611.1 hypothetical protein ASF58_20780 [Methylobacterium sp. Leaf125]
MSPPCSARHNGVHPQRESAGLAILLVGEPFRWHDALALALVIGGIAIAERPGRRRRGAQGLSGSS